MLEILYRDDYLAAVVKPPGLLVHRTGLDAGETRFALQMLRDQLGRPVWPAHRLDKGTSGVLLFALDAGTARALGRQFEAGDAITKTYQAMVRGWPAPEGLIDHPLRRMTDDLRQSGSSAIGRPATMRAEPDENALLDDRPAAIDIQDALTRYRTLAHYGLPLAHGGFARTRCALVELSPLTGRRHQLRRHLKHIAHPIIGDATHGKGPLNRSVAGLLGVQRLWLHALRLELEHPVTGVKLSFEAAPGPEWRWWEPYRDAITGPAADVA
jgi:tRNA pseudouridine65 synthase